jgi:hypothetical protein
MIENDDRPRCPECGNLEQFCCANRATPSPATPRESERAGMAFCDECSRLGWTQIMANHVICPKHGGECPKHRCAETAARDLRLNCNACQKFLPHRWMPSLEAGPHWRCSECGGVTNYAAPLPSVPSVAVTPKCIGTPHCMTHEDLPTSHGPGCPKWSGAAPHPVTCARCEEAERRGAMAMQERVFAALKVVRYEFAARVEAQHALHNAELAVRALSEPKEGTKP